MSGDNSVGLENVRLIANDGRWHRAWDVSSIANNGRWHRAWDRTAMLFAILAGRTLWRGSQLAGGRMESKTCFTY